MRRLLAAVVLTVLLGVALVVSNGLQLQTGGQAPAESGSAQPSPGQGTTQPGPTQPGPARSGTLPPSSLPPWPQE